MSPISVVFLKSALICIFSLEFEWMAVGLPLRDYIAYKQLWLRLLPLTFNKFPVTDLERHLHKFLSCRFYMQLACEFHVLLIRTVKVVVTHCQDLMHSSLNLLFYFCVPLMKSLMKISSTWSFYASCNYQMKWIIAWRPATLHHHLFTTTHLTFLWAHFLKIRKPHLVSFMVDLWWIHIQIEI